MGKKSSHPEILVICSFSPVTASTWGFFSAFNHWNILPAMFLSGKYLFGNAAFQISAMVIHTVEFVVAVQECPHFITLFMHTPGKSLTWAFNSTGGGVGWGGAGLTAGAGPIGSAWKGTTFEDQMWGWLARLWKFLSGLHFEWF